MSLIVARAVTRVKNSVTKSGHDNFGFSIFGQAFHLFGP